MLLCPDKDNILNRAQDCLVGLAVGDALGTTLEFASRDTFPRLTDIKGGGPFMLYPGQWTDDTSMALALADSLLVQSRFDPNDLMSRFVAWWKGGAYSCTSTCFDIGTTTREALQIFSETGDPFAGSMDESTAGNGSLMRLAPVALFALHDEEQAVRIARDQSRLTHAAPQAVEACAFFVTLLQEAILGLERDNVLQSRSWSGHDAVQAVAKGLWRGKSRHEISSSGYVVSTLETVLWAVYHTSSFEDALVLAVNLGHDANTVGAVTGQPAGALYGASAIPDGWLKPRKR